MKKHIKWIVGASALVAAPFVFAAPASASVGGCATAGLQQPVIDFGPYMVNCVPDQVGNCTENYEPADNAGETVTYAFCLTIAQG